MLIGIVGTLGAGKGTVVECLKEQGFVHYSASGLLREMLEERGEIANRESYTVLGDELRSINPAGPIGILYARHKDKNVDTIIESIHDVPEAEFLKAQGGIILGVDADLETRYQRISVRGSEKDGVSFEQFRQIATHEEDGGGKHNIRAVMKMADFVIRNDSSLADLQTEVDVFLQKFHD